MFLLNTLASSEHLPACLREKRPKERPIATRESSKSEQKPEVKTRTSAS